jgi:hypothetical protein
MKISELYGKRVESGNGKRVGYVLGAACEGNKITFILCCDEHEREFYVDVNNITHIGESVVFEDAKTKLKRAKILRLGKAGYLENGNFLGTLKDCEVSGFDIKRAYIGSRSFPFSRLICGDIVIVKKPEQKEKTTPPHELLIDAVLGN